jgi:hypothetical protein
MNGDPVIVEKAALVTGVAAGAGVGVGDGVGTGVGVGLGVGFGVVTALPWLPQPAVARQTKAIQSKKIQYLRIFLCPPICS